MLDTKGDQSDRPGELVSVDRSQQELIQTLEDVEVLADVGDLDSLDNLVCDLHPADFAALFSAMPRRLWPEVVARLDIGQISDLMEELPDHLRDDVAELLKSDQLAEAIEEMASDDAADVLADLPTGIAQRVIAALSKEDRQEVERLLAYPEDSAGGLMQTELVSVVETATVEETVEAIRANSEEVGPFHFIYVVDRDERLVGVLNLAELILSKPDQAISGLVTRDIQVVAPDVDQEDVAWMFSRYDLVVLPVVGENKELLGRILHDDIVDVLSEEADEDILHMSGTTVDEPELVYTDQLFKIASVRLPWLLATLAGLTVPALLVWAFQVSFPHMLMLVPFIPVIGAMGGNVGAQSSTIVVRGFATGRVDFQNLGSFLGRELVISFLMGAACGALSGLVAVVWHGDWTLSLTVTLSMLVAIVASAILGVLVPYLFRLIRIDPAIAAGPLVTTIDDIVAIGIYYVAALLIIGT